MGASTALPMRSQSRPRILRGSPVGNSARAPSRPLTTSGDGDTHSRCRLSTEAWPSSDSDLSVLRDMRLSGASVEPAEVALSQLVFGKADVVGRGGDRQGSFYCDDHYPSDA